MTPWAPGYLVCMSFRVWSWVYFSQLAVRGGGASAYVAQVLNEIDGKKHVEISLSYVDGVRMG